MDKKITKVYKATTIAAYNELLALVVSNNFAVNINTSRETQTISLDFYSDDTEAIQEVADAVDPTCVTITDGEPAFVFTEDSQLAQDLEAYKHNLKCATETISRVSADRDSAAADRDMYKELFRKQSKETCRIQTQIRAIGTLLNAICPEKA